MSDVSPASEPLWRPTPSRIEGSALGQFMKRCGRSNYWDLHRWSIDQNERFWSEVWDFCDVIGGKGARAFVEHDDIKACDYFPDARVNFAENLLRDPDESDAIIFVGEDGRRDLWSRKRLFDQVSRLRQAMVSLGIGRGDRVAGFVANMPEAIAAMLATLSLGAIWSSCSPDFGVAGVEDRFGQIEPKLLFAANGYFYGGKPIDSRERLKEIGAKLPSLQAIVVWDYALDAADLSMIEKAVSLDEFIRPYEPAPIPFVRIGVREPGFILFSSGTTGKPKCIVHSAGGLLLQHLKEHRLHCDVRAQDRFFYFTTCGWMMWNFLVSGLASNACLILYDGNPTYPNADRLIEIAETERIDLFGTSAKYIDALSKAGVVPKSRDISPMRSVFSTGSPLAHESFDYIYQSWGSDIHLASISGGTDICGCFMGGAVTLPVWRGEIQAPLLGIDAVVFDDDGNEAVGAPGELVCRNAHPSMPVGFWNDPDGARYHAAYFDTYPNVWRHGDWLERTPHHGFVMAGRSDATLNPGGVRIGTAEIYRQVERVPEVMEAIVVGQDWQNDQRVILFVRLRDNAVLDDQLIKRIKTEIRNNTTPRHVPSKVIEIADIPRTKSGKIVELAVRDVIHGRTVRNQTALANPEALALYQDLDALRD